jgi:RNA:NAD 2'-phosphotransferase (TPT1/KptA family)
MLLAFLIHVTPRRFFYATSQLCKKKSKHQGTGGYRGVLKLHGPDITRVRISKNISRILRHDALAEGIRMRTDGYVKVSDLVWHSSLTS